MRMLFAMCAAVAALAAGAVSTSAAGRPPVLVIGDSVATGMLWHPSAVKVLDARLDVEWQIAVCRTVAGTSCPYEGARPLTLVDLVDERPSVPPIVVVEVGYNDSATGFADAVDEAIAALVAKGAQHVLWLTLHTWDTQYVAMNAALREAATKWPQLELVDWAAVTRNNYSWFQGDGVHLRENGGIVMAHLIHRSVMQIVDPLRVVTPALTLHDGRTYTVRLRAAGGMPPYRWGVARGRPPRGFHLLADGTLIARPPRGARAAIDVAVKDADGATAEVRVGAG
jgi:hypothetical protein